MLDKYNLLLFQWILIYMKTRIAQFVRLHAMKILGMVYKLDHEI